MEEIKTESAPCWARFLAQDGDGVWYWHASKPKPNGVTVCGEGYWISTGESCIACRGELLGDWRSTLEKRPEEFKPSIEEANRLAQEFKPFTSVEDNQGQEMKQDNGWFERVELPPVGVECEILWNDAEWHKTKILAHLHIDKFNICPIFTTDWDDTAFVDCMPHYKSFRPIRTDRELAIEVMLKDSGALECDAVMSILENLLDKGWVKGSK